MIITPARFEDAIKREYNKPEEASHYMMVNRNAFEIMCKTLDSMGYGAGVNRITEEEMTS